MIMADMKIATEVMVVGGKTIRPGQPYDPKLVSGEDKPAPKKKAEK